MNYEKLTLEELILLKEAEEDHLQQNPLDSSANSRYNYLSKLIEDRVKNA